MKSNLTRLLEKTVNQISRSANVSLWCDLRLWLVHLLRFFAD